MTCSAMSGDARRFPRAGFALLIGLVALAAAGKAVLYDTFNPDCFWHLRVAEQILHDGMGPLIDHLSFASIQAPWTPYSWLAELGMRGIWVVSGWRGAIAVQALLQAGFVGMIAWSCRAGAGHNLLVVIEHSVEDLPAPGALSSAVATAFAAFLSLAHLSFRPVTAALVLLAACAALLVRDRRLGERSTLVWGIVPITALIVNLHLYAVIVPIWIVALLGGAVWECRAHRFNHPEAERRVARYGYLLVACLLACLATPMLPGVIGTALHYQFADPMVAGGFIAEMQPFYRGAFGRVAAALVAGMGICVLVNHRRLRAGEWLWLGLSTVLLFRFARFAPVFAIAAAPLLAATLPKFSDRALARPLVCTAMLAVLIAGAARIGAAFPRSDTTLSAWLNRNDPQAPGFPCGAADYVARDIHPSTGRLLNEFNWGGYLEWQLGPQYQTLLDGRTQLFTPEFWQATYLGNDEDRRRFFAPLAADAAVLPARNSKFRASLIALGWRPVFKDDRAEVLLPPQKKGEDPLSRWAPAAMLFRD